MSQSTTPTPPQPEDLWRYFFPFNSAYQAQEDGIKKIITNATGEAGGYAVLEGACGTGKTLLSAVAALALIRSPETEYSRIFITTSVKQQLSAFEDDLKQINDHLKSLNHDQIDVAPRYVAPITATTLVGKADICPYTYTGHIDSTEIYGHCATLQEQTRDLYSTRPATDDKRRLGAQLTRSAEQAKETEHVGTPIVANPETHPYPDTPMKANGDAYCPYYAQSQLDEINGAAPIDAAGDVISRVDLTRKALNQGCCPHEAMKEVAPSSEILIGNYSHILQPGTLRAFTQHLIDKSTFLICDEAHTLPDVARNVFSHAIPLTDLSRGTGQLKQIVDWYDSGDAEKRGIITDALESGDFTVANLRQFIEAVSTTVEHSENVFQSKISDSSVSMSKLSSYGRDLEYSEHIPLRDPATPETDAISAQRKLHMPTGSNDPTEYGAQLELIVRRIYKTITEDVRSETMPDPFLAPSVCRFIYEYYTQNHTEYYREFEVISTNDRRAPTNIDSPLHNVDIPQPVLLKVENCIPAGKLSNTFDRFRGGVCMSATISPHSIYEQEVGLTYQDGSLTNLEYGLEFPEENRETIAVDLPKYTRQNRDESTAASEQERKAIKQTQQQYYDAVKTVVTSTPGNVLVAGPSYGTTETIAEQLQDDAAVSKEVLIDESSTDEETTQLREQFVSGDPKVLATGMRGTLTEGVDYNGDALKATAIFGVPIQYLGNPKSTAIKAAYREAFTDNGSNADSQAFFFAHGIPAIRKARQAIGRVIRSETDVGVRVLIDERYTQQQYQNQFGSQEQTELTEVTDQELAHQLASFWQLQS
jgi:DNA excision repair protein ERCC-2